jgi:hypothetical protein
MRRRRVPSTDSYGEADRTSEQEQQHADQIRSHLHAAAGPPGGSGKRITLLSGSIVSSIWRTIARALLQPEIRQ